MDGAATTVDGLHQRDAALICLFVAACRHRWDAVPGELETPDCKAVDRRWRMPYVTAANRCDFTVE